MGHTTKEKEKRAEVIAKILGPMPFEIPSLR